MAKKEEDDFMFNEITGAKGKKTVMSVLNKSKISKFEMDELFCDD
jgi:hypothetical protein